MVRKLELVQMVHVPPPIWSGIDNSYLLVPFSCCLLLSPPLSLLLHASFLPPPPPSHPILLPAPPPLSSLPPPLYSSRILSPPNILPFFLTANRTEPNLKDLAQAFADIAELSEFCREVESTKPPQAIPSGSLSKSLHLSTSRSQRGESRSLISHSGESPSRLYQRNEQENVWGACPLTY